MAQIKKGANALVIHGGGPTAVLNASLVGIVEACRAHPQIRSLYGALHGASGLLESSFLDLSAEPAQIWSKVLACPGSVLGSSRKKLSGSDFDRMLDILKRHEIRYVYVTGGNGTMEMALRLCQICRIASYESFVIGVPKTIDNDIPETDHTPGYASAARFFIHCFSYIGADNRALPGVTIVEVLGRHAGWLTAATALARKREDDAPHLVYLPERRMSLEQLAADVDRVYRKLGRVVVAVCEGQLDESGEPFGADVRTSSRAPLALNLGHVLAKRLSEKLNISTRSEKPGLLGRSCAALVSQVDLSESRACGAAAVQLSLQGHTQIMAAIKRLQGADYQVSFGAADLTQVVGRERLFPSEWMPQRADDNMPKFCKWLTPMVEPIEGAAALIAWIH